MVCLRQENVVFVRFRKMTTQEAKMFLGDIKYKEALKARKKILLLWSLIPEPEDFKTAEAYAAIFAMRFKKFPKNHSAEVIHLKQAQAA
jgi:hypothetical protein